MTDLGQEWVRTMSLAWYAGEAGDHAKSLRCYKYAQELIDLAGLSQPVNVNPELSLLRHTSVDADGFISPLPPTEDMVMSIQLPSSHAEALDAEGMYTSEISQHRLTQSIKNYSIPVGTPIYGPNVMVLSTGRVGTVSLFRLLERTQYIPYHSYFMQIAREQRTELACRFIAEETDPLAKIERQWEKTRKPEWIGCQNIGRPMAMLNHMDTIFAPTYALINPMAKFLFLRRDPEKVFKSFYAKDQFRANQLEPVYFKFSPDFAYRKAMMDMPATIAWYIKFTEAFSRAVGEVYPERFIEISSDKLFAQDDEEVARLSEFLCIDKDMAKQHFGTVYNEKAHKVQMTEEQIQAGLEAFRRAYGE